MIEKPFSCKENHLGGLEAICIMIMVVKPIKCQTKEPSWMVQSHLDAMKAI